MRRLCTGALLCLIGSAGIGCPVPDITVPDFTPVAPVDAGSADSKAPGGGGDGGDLLGGAGWTQIKQAVVSTTLRGVWTSGLNTGVVYAVGQDGTVLRRSGGGDFQAETSGIKENLYAVLGLGDGTEAFAVGGSSGGMILHRQGGKWAVEGNGLNLRPLLGLCAAGSDLFAVGENGSVAHRTPDGKWQAESAPMQVNLQAAYGTKPDDVYAVGAGGTVVHRDKTGTWAADTATVAMADMGNFFAIASLGGTLYVAGSQGRVLHRETGQWVSEFSLDLIKADMAGAPADLFGILSSEKDNELVVVGSSGVVVHRDAMKMWSREKSATGNDLYAVSGTGVHGLIAVGGQGTVVRRD